MTRKRTLAAIISALLAVVFALSLAYLAVEAEHHCTGKDCPVCHNIQVCIRVLTGTAGLCVLGALVLQSAVARATPFVPHPAALPAQTLVSLKVKLNN